MGATSIQWTDRSVNPIRARNKATGAIGHYCEKVSPGCANCYASAWNERVRPNGDKLIGTGLAFVPANAHKVEHVFDGNKLAEVRTRKAPTKWFWCDMTDMFGSWVPDAWIDQCLATMALTPQHTHQVLTKRADRRFQYFAGWARERIAAVLESWGYRNVAMDIMSGFNFGCGDLPRWPLPNVWHGVSGENRRFLLDRVEHLARTPAAVRFLSLEPVLNDVAGDLQVALRILGQRYPRWVIVGGESGSGARPFDLAWARSIVAECKAAGVPVFVKQLGANIISRNDAGFEGDTPTSWPMDTNYEDIDRGYQGAPVRIRLKDRKGGDPSEWPEDLRVREFPKVPA